MISAFDSAMVLPISSVISRASSSARSAISLKASWRISERSLAGLEAHSFCAAHAASIAAFASSGVPSAISQSALSG